MKRPTPYYVVAIVSSVLSFAASANDDGLYAEAAPADASFIRFVGYDATTVASFAGKAFTLTQDEATSYIPVSSAKLQGVKPGAFVTVVRDGDGVERAISEGPRSDASKISLFLVNATDRVLELRVSDGSVTVIENVASMNAGQRGVNPVAIEFGVFERGSNTPLATFDTSLRRGQNVTFLADERGVRLIENRFGRVAK
jgi:alginate O-acetyltransferase complex protein AlgF